MNVADNKSAYEGWVASEKEKREKELSHKKR